MRGERRGRGDPDRRLLGARLRPDLRRPATASAPACSSASTPGARSSPPTPTTRSFATRVLETLGEPRRDATHFVLEGGSITVDGEGTLITTEQCLFEEHRNPQPRARGDRGGAARRTSASSGSIWLGLGLVEDDDTDGHVDNICAFVAPGKVVLQTVTDEANPNYEHCQDNLRRLRDAGPRGRRAAVAALRRRRGAGGRRAVHELLHLQRRADRPDPRRGDRRRGARAARVAATRAARRSPSRARPWRWAAAGSTASRSRSPPPEPRASGSSTGRRTRRRCSRSRRRAA